MANEHQVKLQNGENYKTSKTKERQNKKCQILQNGERQNVESYRKAKDKTSILQNVERQNVKSYRTAI